MSSASASGRDEDLHVRQFGLVVRTQTPCYWEKKQILRMPRTLSLNSTEGSSTIRCLSMTSSPTLWWPGRRQEQFGLESVLDLEIAVEVRILPPGPGQARCNLSLPPTRQNLTQDQWPETRFIVGIKEGESRAQAEPRLELCWTMLFIGSIRAMWAWWALLNMDSNVSSGTDAWL